MWSDNQTAKDFVNFSGVANTVSEIILQASGEPISIGISGAWGTGKSSMIELIKKSLIERSPSTEEGHKKYVIVGFNAWLYQGYDDARAALVDVVASRLSEEAKSREKGIEKAKKLLQRVNWLRVGKLIAGAAIPLAFGLPPIGIASSAIEIIKKIREDKQSVSAEDMDTFLKAASGEQQALIKSQSESSPPKEIQQIRDAFKETLTEMEVTLVVLIDDLDRCLPATAISTLEAIRLLLFLENTAFVIAADNDMIKSAVKNHFENIGEEHITSYFDKLIQLPIQVPHLGTQDVRAYMLLLFVENSNLSEDSKEIIRSKVCEQLSKSWQGKSVNKAFIDSIGVELPTELVARLDTADRLAPIMTTASRIAGNPRLIKRFLNALSISMAIAKDEGITIDEAHLTKILLFERCGSRAAYEELRNAVNASNEGKAEFLGEIEKAILAGDDPQYSKAWQENREFLEEWLRLPPNMGDVDLRAALYLSRDHAPLITPGDKLTSEGAELLKLLLGHPKLALKQVEILKALPPNDATIIMSKLLEKARQEQSWGTPEVLDACIALGEAHPAQGRHFASFLMGLPAKQITSSIVPKVQDQPWAAEVFGHWSASDVSSTVKNAITRSKE